MSKKLVSICIPTYNRAKIIAYTLESVINQTYKNLEIIVSDNCSTDNTYNIIYKYAKDDKRIKLFKMDKNRGPVENWKNCFFNSTGEYVKFLWSDDYIDKDFIERGLDAFNNEIGFIYSPVKWYDVKTLIVKHNNIGFEQSFSVNYIDFFIESLILSGSVPVSGSCAIFRRNVMENLFSSNIQNCLNIDYKINGAGFDALMFLYAYKEYKKFGYLNCVFTYFGVDSDGITVSSGQKLTPYYFSIFYDFLKKFKNDEYLIGKFKSRVLFYKIMFTTDDITKDLLAKLLSMMNQKINKSYFIYLIFNELIKNKITNLIKRVISIQLQIGFFLKNLVINK